MTNESRKMSGFILLSVPSIIYGGYFLLSVLSGEQEQLQLTDFQKAMFRAGHAHAGVLVILSLVAQIFADYAALSKMWLWITRFLFPISAIVISFGFFCCCNWLKHHTANKFNSGIVFWNCLVGGSLGYFRRWFDKK